MTTAVFRYSPRDALLPAITVAQSVALVALARLPAPLALAAVAVHVWWTSNTVAHIHLHTPIFGNRAADRAFSLWLSALTFIPQTIWKQRHLWHHAGEPVSLRRPRLGAQGRLEIAVVALVAIAVLLLAPRFALTAVGPGVAVGLLLCQLQGAMEHTRDGGAVSHYGALYNFFWFNDGHHVEHHRRPTEHWTRLRRANDATTSAFPPFLRFVDRVPAILGWLEKLNFGSSFLRNHIVAVHRRAIARALADRTPSRVAVVGGGLFPRTVLALQPLLPRAAITVIDASAESIAIARAHLGAAAESVEFIEACWDERHDHYDLVIFPLAYVGDRAQLYRGGRSLRLIHDWVWRGRGALVSLLLLKRLNVVDPA
jgi:hypothetical protein